MLRSQRLFVGAATAVLAYLIGARGLRRLSPERSRFELRAFEPADWAIDEFGELLLTEQPELLLTEADRLHPPAPRAGELVLEDILAELDPDSRVVRLFDSAAMPTPGQLNTRIEQHLRDEPTSAAPGDASEALYEALNELRRSLR
jgi:hypothetical protein